MIKLDFQHKQSAHCENGVVSNLLNFYGIRMSEPLVYGIGSGLFFAYMPFKKIGGIPVSSFRPLPGVIFRRVTNKLNIKIYRKRFRDPDEAMQQLNKSIEKGIPTGMLVGVYHLSYFPKPYRFHFNAHNIVVYGRENGSYLISDPIMETPETLSYKELMRVRFAKGLFAPRGYMYYIKHIENNIDFKKPIVDGIKKTCKDMLTIPVPMFGVKGIRYLARNVRKWPEKLEDKKALLYLGQVIRTQEEIGTGGAGFRFIYAAFLQEAAEILQQDWLNEMSEKMTEVGDQWRYFAVMSARIVKNRSEKQESFNDAANLLYEIAGKEEKIFKELKKISLKK